MNPLGIIAIAIAIVVSFFGLEGLGLVRSGIEPLATGPGGGAEVRNPVPVLSPQLVPAPTSVTGRAPAREPAAPTAPGVSALPRPAPGESPYRGKVVITAVVRGSDRTDREFVTIRYQSPVTLPNSNIPVALDVSGWRIGTERESELIPKALNIPELDVTERDIILPLGGDVVMVSGTPSYQKNFRENQCVGYFNQAHSFTPSLSNACVDDNPNRAVLLEMGLNGACIDAIHGISACRTPIGPFFVDAIKEACIEYMNQNLNYVGCVRNFRDTRLFFRDTWRVKLGRSRKLFDPLHDTVLLHDENGLIVDRFEY